MKRALSSEDISHFLEEGFIVKRGVVPTAQLEAASRLVLDWYSLGMDPELTSAYTDRTFAPELMDHPDLLALYWNSDVHAMVAELIGDVAPVSRLQIQIRVPESDTEHRQPVKAMHVDGVSCPHLDADELRTFSLLVGLPLTPISDIASGALRFVPGGHLRMADWFRTEWRLGITDQVPPEIDAESGSAFLAQPGDVLLLHHLVPHAVGSNLGERPRVIVYFRTSHVLHSQRRIEALQDPWLDFAGVRALR